MLIGIGTEFRYYISFIMCAMLALSLLRNFPGSPRWRGSQTGAMRRLLEGSDLSFDYVIGLGGACGCAYQIRRHFSQEIAFPLDWMVTPFDSIGRLLDVDIRGLGDPGNLAPYLGGPMLINTRFMTLQPHEIETAGKPLPPDWRDRLQDVKSKHDYLADRWISVMTSNSRILLVRHQGRHHLDGDDTTRISVAEANELAQRLRARYPNPTIDILFASAIDPKDAASLNQGIHRAEVRYTDDTEWPDDGDKWRGASSDWRAAFDNVLASSAACTAAASPS